MNFWIGFLIGICVTYSLTRADFYIQLSRGNIKLKRPYTKYEMLIIGNVTNARENYERKKQEKNK